MLLYSTVILGAMLLIALGDSLNDGTLTLISYAKSLLVVFIGVVLVIAIDGVAAFIVRRLPEKWFSPDAKLFDVSDKERLLYRKLKINSWKNQVPELGCFTGFHKDHLEKTDSSTYLGRFLLESNYGVVGHIAGAILGFSLLLMPFLHPLIVALPISAINAVLSILPTMILRFNTPSLRRLYHRSLKKEEQAKMASVAVSENQN